MAPQVDGGKVRTMPSSKAGLSEPCCTLRRPHLTRLGRGCASVQAPQRSSFYADRDAEAAMSRVVAYGSEPAARLCERGGGEAARLQKRRRQGVELCVMAGLQPGSSHLAQADDGGQRCGCWPTESTELSRSTLSVHGMTVCLHDGY